jgi:flagellar hook-basal body complex protein FliE
MIQGIGASALVSGLNGVPSAGSEVIHQAGGAQFSFKLPEQPKVESLGAQTYADATSMEPTNWGQMLQRMAMDVSQSQATAASKVQDVLAGGTTPVHEATIAMQEAGVKFQMITEVRNKVVEAYQEIMRMQV